MKYAFPLNGEMNEGPSLSPLLNDCSGSREFQLLLQCIRSYLNESSESDVEHLCVEGVDWRFFVALTRRHRLLPQVHSVLRHFDDTPAPIKNELAGQLSAMVRWNLLLAAELVRIARRFNKLNIPILGFKGPVLAQQAYGGLQRRQFIDLDIMIEPQRLSSAIEILKGAGYEVVGPQIQNLNSRQMGRLIRIFNEKSFVRADGPETLVVDLHWRFADDPAFFPIACERLFSDDSRLVFCGEPIHTIPLPELLFYLAFHGGKHRWMRLSWLCDFARTIHQLPNPDWNSIRHEAARIGAERYLISGLLILEQLSLVEDLSDKIDGLNVWRRRLTNVTTIMRRTLSADEALPLEGALAAGMWRFRFSGRIQHLLFFLFKSLRPMQNDLLQGGLFRAYLSRWRYLAHKAVQALLPTKNASQ